MRNSWKRPLWNLALVCFSVHAILWSIFWFLPETPAGSFIHENFIRLADPVFWLLWFFGFYLAVTYGLFSTQRSLLLVSLIFGAYFFSVVPAVVFGFPWGFAVSAVLFLILMITIWFSRRNSKNP